MGIERQKYIIRELSHGNISGEELSRKFGISRTALWKDIKALREQGFLIEGTSSKGYSLLGEPEILNEASLAFLRKTRWLGNKITVRKAIPSTHEEAKKIALESQSRGMVIAAVTQTGGKGRLGRRWFSPEGGLWFSAVLKPAMPLKDVPKIGLICAKAIAGRLESYGISAKIKWPNDVIVDSKKIAGILLETSGEPDAIDYVILSAGININVDVDELPEEVKNISASVKQSLGTKISANQFFADLLLDLENQIDEFEASWDSLLKQWKDLDVLSGKKITVSFGERSVNGFSKGIDVNGFLVLETESGKKISLASGEITSKMRFE